MTENTYRIEIKAGGLTFAGISRAQNMMSAIQNALADTRDGSFFSSSCRVDVIKCERLKDEDAPQ